MFLSLPCYKGGKILPPCTRCAKRQNAAFCIHGSSLFQLNERPSTLRCLFQKYLLTNLQKRRFHGRLSLHGAQSRSVSEDDFVPIFIINLIPLSVSGSPPKYDFLKIHTDFRLDFRFHKNTLAVWCAAPMTVQKSENPTE